MGIASDKEVIARAASILQQIEQLQQELNRLLGSRREAMLARVRQIQDDPQWLEELQKQYTPEVAKRTLELNEEFSQLEEE